MYIHQMNNRFINGCHRHRNVIVIIAVILLFAACAADIKASKLTTFRNGVSLDGVDVSGMTVTEATEEFNAKLNTIEFSDDAGHNDVVNTKFVFANEYRLNEVLRLSYFDIRAIFSGKLGKAKLLQPDYEVKLYATSGVEATGTVLKEMYPPSEGTTVTQDAYVDYETVTIVEEVQGNNPDYDLIANDIAKKRVDNPTKNTYSCRLADYIKVPSVTSEDLADELAFAKEYIEKGMDINAPNGQTIHIYSELTAKIIKYSKSGPKYDLDGAAEVASEIAIMSIGKGDIDKTKVSTVEGEKELYNFAIAAAIDIQKSAESLVEAAKNGTVGTVYKDPNGVQAIGNHLEVSISSQTVYYVENGEIVIETPCVTGNYGYETPAGIYKLAYKVSPATLTGKNADGTDYESKVRYWMPFNGGIGLHDADWRSTFGGSIYRGNGSHGCVNLPIWAASSIFHKLSAGSVILVYY